MSSSRGRPGRIRFQSTSSRSSAGPDRVASAGGSGALAGPVPSPGEHPAGGPPGSRPGRRQRATQRGDPAEPDLAGEEHPGHLVHSVQGHGRLERGTGALGRLSVAAACMVVSCAWRRNQNRAVAGFGPNAQHRSCRGRRHEGCRAGRRRSRAVPGDQFGTRLRGGLGPVSGRPVTMAPRAQRCTLPRWSASAARSQPGQAGTGAARSPRCRIARKVAAALQVIQQGGRSQRRPRFGHDDLLDRRPYP